ncbi:MAG: M48 family metallopeptidase [Candidatus Acidiferrales bacterium]
MAYLSVAAVLLLFAPALVYRHTALERTDTDGAAVWLGYRRLSRFILTAMVAGWSAIWDLSRHSHSTHAAWLRSLAPPGAGVLFFWLPPIAGLGLYLVFCYAADKAVLNLRWSFWDIVRQAWWRMASFVVPLQMVAMGFQDIFDGAGRGIAWIIGAGLVARLGVIFLRRAEGIKLHETKSGELRNRAFSVARKMNTTIQRVYIVPAGKGHLTNAYGMSRAIGVTDNLGKYLTRPEVDDVIAHEVAHVKHRHGLKRSLFAIALFSAMTLVLFRLPNGIRAWKPVLDLLVIFAPVMAFYFLSRRFEYAADREAVKFTGDPETAIRALLSLYQVSAVPIRCNRFLELFQTHPALGRRARAIGRAGQLPAQRVADILRDAIISKGAVSD